jgi:hypothetical protein
MLLIGLTVIFSLVSIFLCLNPFRKKQTYGREARVIIRQGRFAP